MQEKFTEFYKKYESFMFYIANDMLKDSFAAEDVVQVAFINMYKNFHKIGDIDSAETRRFVVVVTRRAAIDFDRRRQKQSGKEAPYEEYVKEADSKYTEIVIGDNEVIECINRIPQKYADVLTLKYVQGYKTREIAELLNNPHGTIRSHISRGKKLLQEELEKSGIAIKV